MGALGLITERYRQGNKFYFLLCLAAVLVLGAGIFAACSEQAFAEGTENIAQIWQAKRSSIEEVEYIDSTGKAHKALVLTLLDPENLNKNITDETAVELTALLYANTIPIAYQSCDVLQIIILKDVREITGKVIIKDAQYASNCFTASNALTEQIKKRNTYNFESYFNTKLSADTTVTRVKQQLEQLFEKVDPSSGLVISGYKTDTTSTKLYFHLSTADTTVECEIDFTPKGAQIQNLFLSPYSLR